MPKTFQSRSWYEPLIPDRCGEPVITVVASFTGLNPQAARCARKFPTSSMVAPGPVIHTLASPTHTCSIPEALRLEDEPIRVSGQIASQTASFQVDPGNLPSGRIRPRRLQAERQGWSGLNSWAS